MVLIPAGEFTMGCNERVMSDIEGPERAVYLDSFNIDAHEVTNGRYRECVRAGVCEPPMESSSSTRDSYYGNPEYDDYPVIYVSWYDAQTYCEWAGKRLPTEAEWQKATRGSDGRTYLWGDQWDESSANCCGVVGDTSAVGSYPRGASPYGVQDMVGNVWEWVADWYDPDYYKRAPDRNPKGPSSGSLRVQRGGSWSSTPTQCYARNPDPSGPDHHALNLGFRCAQTLQLSATPTATFSRNPTAPTTPRIAQTPLAGPRPPTPGNGTVGVHGAAEIDLQTFHSPGFKDRKDPWSDGYGPGYSASHYAGNRAYG